MTFAQFVGGGPTGIIGIMNLVIVPIIFALAFLVFIWGVANYFFIHSDDEGSAPRGGSLSSGASSAWRYSSRSGDS